MFKPKPKPKTSLGPKLIDRRFNSEECKQIERTFSSIDRNSSGYISKQEMVSALKNSKSGLTEAHILFTFSAMDTDGDGKISLKEFANFVYMSKNPQKDDSDEVRRIFSGFDSNKDGLIEKGELALALSSLGLRVSSNDIDRFFKFIDSDKSGNLDFEEFQLFYNLVRSRN